MRYTRDEFKTEQESKHITPKIRPVPKHLLSEEQIVVKLPTGAIQIDGKYQFAEVIAVAEHQEHIKAIEAVKNPYNKGITTIEDMLHLGFESCRGATLKAINSPVTTGWLSPEQKLTPDEAKCLLECFEIASNYRYGKTNKQAPIYLKLQTYLVLPEKKE